MRQVPVLDLRSKIKRDADRCVMCGLCLPHCPTYRDARDEGESPRGRISLMNALAAGRLPLDRRLEDHLDHCLACRACEDVCPSQVPYGALIDAGRALIRSERPGSWSRRRVIQPLLKALLTRKGMMRNAARLGRIYQRSGLARLARKRVPAQRASLSRLNAYLPPLPRVPRWQPFYPPSGGERGRLALFTGCVNPVLDADTIHAAIRLLNRLGYGVHVPAGQVCCGALHLHGGDPETAGEFARRNITVFNTLGCEAVISVATGCGATLSEYPVQPDIGAEPGDAAAFAAGCRDINDFLARSRWPDTMTVAPSRARIAVHDPCSMRRVLHRDAAVYQLLCRIPGAEIVALPGNAACCGAAGSNMLTQPALADRLRRPKLEALTALNADAVATSNIGCALHLTAGLRERGLSVPVVHPVVLLDKQVTEHN